MTPLVECVKCGACCFSESPRHARVTGDDYERLTEVDIDRFVEWRANEAFMKIEGDEGHRHCAALIVDRARGTFMCEIYDRRPQVCRDLERASGACEGERLVKLARTRPSSRR